jgi:hypothetical protein
MGQECLVGRQQRGRQEGPSSSSARERAPGHPLIAIQAAVQNNIRSPPPQLSLSHPPSILSLSPHPLIPPSPPTGVPFIPHHRRCSFSSAVTDREPIPSVPRPFSFSLLAQSCGRPFLTHLSDRHHPTEDERPSPPFPISWLVLRD